MLIIGSGLVAAALLTLVALVPVFRAPRPPRWTRRRWVGEAVALTIVGTFALGFVSLCAGLYRAYQSGPTALETGVVALVFGLAAVLWRQLGRRRARAAPVSPAAGETAGPAPQEPQPSPPSRTRRAA